MTFNRSHISLEVRSFEPIFLKNCANNRNTAIVESCPDGAVRAFLFLIGRDLIVFGRQMAAFSFPVTGSARAVPRSGWFLEIGWLRGHGDKNQSFRFILRPPNVFPTPWIAYINETARLMGCS